MCSSQRSQAFELATTKKRLQVGGGYIILIKASYGVLAKLIILKKEGYIWVMITVKLVLWIKFCAVKLLNSVRLNSPRV